MQRNIVLAHAKCNHDRGCQSPTETEIERAKTIYAKMGIRPFVPPDARTDPDFTMPRERVLKSWQTYTAPKLKDIWPHG